MAKKRVHEIAKERGITSKEALEVLRKAGLEVKVAASSVEEEEAAKAFGNGAGATAPAKAAPKKAAAKKAPSKKAAAQEASDGAPAAEAPAAPQGAGNGGGHNGRTAGAPPEAR